MKYIKEFNIYNESKIGDFFRKKFNSDEETAMGIFDKIDDNLQITQLNSDSYDMSYYTDNGYQFEIDDFLIVCKSHLSFDRFEHSISIDDVNLKCSETISKKIFKKVDSIFNKENTKRKNQRDEDDKYIKKDAKIHFGKR